MAKASKRKAPKKGEALANKGLLTRQEQKIMQLIVQGAGHNEIMKQLKIAYETFKTHRKNILAKLKVKNVVQLAQMALQQNLAKRTPVKRTLIFIEITDKDRKKLADLSAKKDMAIKQYCEALITKHLKSPGR